GWDTRLPHATLLSAVRDRATDRIAHILRDEEVDVCPLWSEGVVGRSPQRLTCLPPAVLRGNHPGVERGVELCFERDRSLRRLQDYPCRVPNLQGRGRGRVDLQERLPRLASQARNVAVVVIAELY